MSELTFSIDSILRVREINGKKNPRACIITFGCQQNEADSERVRGMAIDMGYTLQDSYIDADLIIVNTCAIREHAEMKALSMLGNFKVEKQKNPDLIIGIIGCMSAEAHIVDKLKRDFHYVSFTVEPNMLHRIPEAIYKKLSCGERSFIIGEDKGDVVEGVPTCRTSSFRAWVSVMYGCNNFCSYCIVPYTRGRERSRSSKEVIEECRALVMRGVKEITLLGQNVNSYSSDCDFPELLRRIADIEGDFIIRFMTSHPKDVSARLVGIMAGRRGKIAPYFHLPLQSGSNKILSLMNRVYNRDEYLSVVNDLRLNLPGIALSTDIIVGFPGETDEDFSDTLDILRRVRFDGVYAFRFSSREGTPAAKMPDAVDSAVVEKRMSELFGLCDGISRELNEEYVGRVVRALVEGPSKKPGVFTARTDTNKLVHFVPKRARVGEFVNIKIERAQVYDLFGTEI